MTGNKNSSGNVDDDMFPCDWNRLRIRGVDGNSGVGSGRGKDKGEKEDAIARLERFYREFSGLSFEEYLKVMKERREEIKKQRMKEEPSLKQRFESEKPVYFPGIEMARKLTLKKGNRLSSFDLNYLLSAAGYSAFLQNCFGHVPVPVSQVVATPKPLFICCFFVPVLPDSHDAQLVRDLCATYEANSVSFQLLIVVKMRTGWEDSSSSFDHFLSAFPPQCLSVPFHEYNTRDFICYSLGLAMIFGTSCASVVLSPDTTDETPSMFEVLHTELHFLTRYGCCSFPFTKDWLNSLDFQDSQLRTKLLQGHHSPLQLLLDLPPFEYLHRCVPSRDADVQDDNDSITVSQLSNKPCVALYLCFDGLLLDQLHRVQQETLALGHQLDVVIFNLSFGSHSSSFCTDMHTALKDRSITSWWELSFMDHHPAQRLWRLVNCAPCDHLITIDTSRTVEFMGGAILNHLGGALAYPFTRASIVKQRMSILRSVNLNSLFGGFSAYVVANDNSLRSIDLHSLRRKNKYIILYLGYTDSYYNSLDNVYELLRSCYKRIRKAGAQVVFVAMDPTPSVSSKLLKMEWPIFSLKGAKSVVDQLFCEYEDVCPTLAVFGRDGTLLSRAGQYHLDAHGDINKSLFADNLHQEIVHDLHNFFIGYYD